MHSNNGANKVLNCIKIKNFLEFYTGKLSYPNIPQHINRIRVSITNGTEEGEELLRETENLVRTIVTTANV